MSLTSPGGHRKGSRHRKRRRSRTSVRLLVPCPPRSQRRSSLSQDHRGPRWLHRPSPTPQSSRRQPSRRRRPAVQAKRAVRSHPVIYRRSLPRHHRPPLQLQRQVQVKLPDRLKRARRRSKQLQLHRRRRYLLLHRALPHRRRFSPASSRQGPHRNGFTTSRRAAPSVSRTEGSALSFKRRTTGLS